MPAARRASIALLACGLTAGLASCSASVPPTGIARERIVGSWELQSRTVRRGSGETVNDPVLGQQPIGRLFYSISGHMALQMMRQGRAQAIGEPASPDEAKNARVVLGYDAYFGTFTVDERAGTVTHHIQGSLFPEDLGQGLRARLSRRWRRVRAGLHVARRGRVGDDANAGVPTFAVARGTWDSRIRPCASP